MPYRLRISREVRNAVDRLPGKVRQRIRRVIAELAYDPRPDTAKALEEDLSGYFRIRVGLYRVIYTIEEDQVLVEVVRVARRSSRTYEGLGE